MGAVYTIEAVQRTPAQVTGPTLAVLGPLEAAFSYTDLLNEAPEATLTVDTNGIQDDIKESLRDLMAQPLEIIIYRDGSPVFQGPLMGGSLIDTEATLTARGLEFYTAYMAVETNKTFDTIDEYTILTELIDDWQAQDYGDFGINTATVGTSGTTRDYYIPGTTEARAVYDTLVELSFEWGFEWYVDPDTRELVLGPRGTDKSGTVFLERGVQSPNIEFGVPPGTLVSELYALGTGADGVPITTTKTDATVRSSFGRVGLAATFDGAENATNLSDAADAYIANRGEPYFAPGPSIVPISGADVVDFNVGDTITYTFDAGLGQTTGAYRIRKRTVSVTNTGQETMQVEFI